MGDVEGIGGVEEEKERNQKGVKGSHVDPNMRIGYSRMGIKKIAFYIQIGLEMSLCFFGVGGSFSSTKCGGTLFSLKRGE